MESLNLSTIIGETELTDSSVVSRVLDGEVTMYELLMRRHNQMLYRIIRSYLKEEQEVEDAMQDTYLAGYEKLYQFRQDARFSTWLVRIGINVALSKIKERKRLFPTSLLVDQSEEFRSSLNLINFMNPEKIVIQQETKQLLEKAIDSIPEKYRIIYTMREVEGMPVHEITQCLNISESNVKIRLLRAKAMLKDKLLTLSENQPIFEFGNKRCDAIVRHVMKALPLKGKL